jgi:hypothetical protein
VVEPAIQYHNFSIAPHYTPIYPRMAAYAGPFYYDPVYLRHYYEYWSRIPLPTAEMLRCALPPGVIRPNGSVSGFLYFERVDPGTYRVRFRADLIDAGNGKRLGEIRIPFTVERKPIL